MVSSRKEENVKKAVDALKEVEGGKVEGMICHVGKRVNTEKISSKRYIIDVYYRCVLEGLCERVWHCVT